MDSEESRPGSSASNSSTSSSNNSRPSSPIQNDEEKDKVKLPANNLVSSPQSSPAGSPRPRSMSKSDSDSSSSSSSDNENGTKSPVSAVHTKSKSSSNRSSSDRSSEKIQGTVSRNQSVSPTNSRHTSIISGSSIRSRSNSHDNLAEVGINISHEDLSDVSDMESEKCNTSTNNSKHSLRDEATNSPMLTESADANTEEKNYSLEENNSQDAVQITDLRQKLDQKKIQCKNVDTNSENADAKEVLAPNESNNADECIEDLVKTHDEDDLDFEAEEGECPEVNKDDENNTLENKANSEKETNSTADKDAEGACDEELEEGEVSDEDEKRPEETEPKPICRFYTRGQCTWGMSCRFLHPGVTDKGNYTMFDLVRPVPVPPVSAALPRSSSYAAHNADFHDYRTDRPSLHHRAAAVAAAAVAHHPASIYPSHHDARPLVPDGPVVVESAWERGLRTAKEMMRKANKRKEQDMDFEDKKMNLTLSPDELEKDPYYLKDRVSPTDVLPPAYGRHGPFQEFAGSLYSPPDRFGRGPPMAPYDEVDPYGRSTRYRELPPHRMPQYEDERRVRPTREVIVQRVEPVTRGDEWNDPWMRSKSPGGRGVSGDRNDKRRRDRRSYSSNSSYSSSSSTQSDSSSDSSRSPSPAEQRRRYNSGSHKSPQVSRRHAVRSVQSPSPPRHSRRSPNHPHSPLSKRRSHMSPSTMMAKKGIYSPSSKRRKLSPKKSINDKVKAKRRQASSSSGSGSSDSSASDSDSDSGSSSSESSSRSRGRTPLKRPHMTEKAKSDRKLVKKDPPKKRSPISIEIKKQTTVGTSALMSPTHSISSEKDSKKSRREELLKQLRAVEDAIAKKRSKLA